jgi:hypothetical protein
MREWLKRAVLKTYVRVLAIGCNQLIQNKIGLMEEAPRHGIVVEL